LLTKKKFKKICKKKFKKSLLTKSLDLGDIKASMFQCSPKVQLLSELLRNPGDAVKKVFRISSWGAGVVSTTLNKCESLQRQTNHALDLAYLQLRNELNVERQQSTSQ